MNWLVIIAAVILLWGVLAIGFELSRIRSTITELLGSIAQSSWRIRDELAELNKHLQNRTGE